MHYAERMTRQRIRSCFKAWLPIFPIFALCLFMPVVRELKAQTTAPLSVRGYTDARFDTAVISGNGSGASVLELRVKEGDKIRRDGVVAVLSSYPDMAVAVRLNEAELGKVQESRQAMVSGYRTTELVVQEANVRQSEKELNLKVLELQRSGKSEEQKQTELRIAEQTLEKDRLKLTMMRQMLASDLAALDSDIIVRKAKLEKAIADREDALVRSPIDGIVMQVWTHSGERIHAEGIVKIVDMTKMGVVADIDETELGRAALGTKVGIAFGSSKETYEGTVARIAPALKRMQLAQPITSNATEARVVQVEIKFDDIAHVPPLLGREVRVTFQ